MVKIDKSNIFDYLIVAQLVICILFFIIGIWKYEGILVYFSLIVFISYWMIGVIFNKKYKDRLS